MDESKVMNGFSTVQGVSAPNLQIVEGSTISESCQPLEGATNPDEPTMTDYRVQLPQK